MFRISLAILVVFTGCGVSGFLYDQLIEFAMNVAQKELHHAKYDPHKDVADFAISLGESAMKTLGAGQAAENKMLLKKFDKLHNDITAISRKIDKLQNYVHDKLDNLVDDFGQMFRELVKYQFELNKLISSMRIIELKYETFQELTQNYFSKDLTTDQRYKVRTIVDFAKRAIQSDKDGLRQSITDMYWLVTPGISHGAWGKPGFFRLLAGHINLQNKTLCGHLSAQQKMYEAYKAISVLDVKGFMILKYSYDLLSHFEKKSYADKQETLAKDFIRRRNNYALEINHVLGFLQRYQRACSPSNYNRDENFIELEGLYGSYIINEFPMKITYHDNYYEVRQRRTFSAATIGSFAVPFPNYQEDRRIFIDCENPTCEILQHQAKYIAQIPVSEGYNTSFIELGDKRCKGEISGCISMGESTSFCRSKEQRGRYGYIKAEKALYGSEDDCEPQKELVSVKSLKNGNYHCDYCLCQCRNSDDDLPDVVKWINTNDHVSDIHNNMAITGLKFERNGTHIEIKIKEGKVITNGEIPESSWTSGFHGNPTYLEIGEAYSKSLVLAHYEAEGGFVLTGLRFKHYYNKYFGIQIRSTRMDFETGKLFPLESSWRDIINQDKLKGELKIENPDIPTRSPKDVLDSENGQYVTFTISDLGKTAGASVIPFIESEPVENIPGFVLDGAGLIHKGRRGYGGFVAFRVSSFDLKTRVKLYLNQTVYGERNIF